MQKSLERGARLSLPEPAALDSTRREPGGRGEAGGADHRGQRLLAPADRGPPQPGGEAFSEMLRIEHRHRADALLVL